MRTLTPAVTRSDDGYFASSFVAGPSRCAIRLQPAPTSGWIQMSYSPGTWDGLKPRTTVP